MRIKSYLYKSKKSIYYSLIVIFVITIISYIQIERISYLNSKNAKNVNNKNPELKSHDEITTLRSKKFEITLNDIFIAVKTTDKFLEPRVHILINTWFKLAQNQTWFFTDASNEKFNKLTGGHLINTHCPQSHSRKSLCCKMSVEIDTFLQTDKKWFCHFDDDNYVNIPQLVRTLKKYEPQNDWYLGKKTVLVPITIHKPRNRLKNKRNSYFFATGGAGFCLSRALALKMVPIAGGGKFMTIADKLRSPDDVTMGYIIEYLIGVPLTVIEEFHSHLESLELLSKSDFHKQISFSYYLNDNNSNVLNVEGFSNKEDPTRFLSLHCFLFPFSSICAR